MDLLRKEVKTTVNGIKCDKCFNKWKEMEYAE